MPDQVRHDGFVPFYEIINVNRFALFFKCKFCFLCQVIHLQSIRVLVAGPQYLSRQCGIQSLSLSNREP
jgi:hypothetical protein